MRPIADAGDQAVLDRIDGAILDVAAEILIVADQTGAAQCATLIAPYGLSLRGLLGIFHAFATRLRWCIV